MRFIATIETKTVRSAERLQEALMKFKLLGEEADVSVEVAPKVPSSRAERLSSAVSAISDARSEIEELKDEMEQWRDSIPENLQGGDKYQQVEACCDELDSLLDEIPDTLDEPEFPGMF